MIKKTFSPGTFKLFFHPNCRLAREMSDNRRELYDEFNQVHLLESKLPWLPGVDLP